MIRRDRLYVWTKKPISFLAKQENHGTCSIFAFVEPLGGCHHVSVREHRTAVDWAEEIKYLVDVMYPDVDRIILVMDNLNTHKPSSLYKKYPPEEVRRIIKKLEIHYTPKKSREAHHGSENEGSSKTLYDQTGQECNICPFGHRCTDTDKLYDAGEG